MTHLLNLLAAIALLVWITPSYEAASVLVPPLVPALALAIGAAALLGRHGGGASGAFWDLPWWPQLAGQGPESSALAAAKARLREMADGMYGAAHEAPRRGPWG